MTSSLLSLQVPKDVNFDDIEAELREIWRVYSSGDDGFSATRASTFTFVVYEPEPIQQLLSALSFYKGPIDGIAGPSTTKAIKEAQKHYKLEVTGISTSELLAKLQENLQTIQAEGKITELNTVAARQYLPKLEGVGVADAIASTNPCRIITICPTTEADEGVKSQVSAYCPINKRSANNLICCEYITLTGTASALERIGGIVSELMIPDLPKFVWWKAGIDPDYHLFKRLASNGDRLIIDSSISIHPEKDLKAIGKLLHQNLPIIDLNWSRLSAWQELTAEAFDPPERRNAIYEVDQVTIDYEQGNPTQALMYLGWLASRLQWTPVEYNYEGGDYDIRKVKFTNKENKYIEAELAGIPLTNWGEVLGDLISLRLSSTNLNADCCTVLCSETTGCMRMESGGGAQSCRIQQVTSVADANTEQLLAKELQRWGKDTLYEESMLITSKILDLKM